MARPGVPVPIVYLLFKSLSRGLTTPAAAFSLFWVLKVGAIVLMASFAKFTIFLKYIASAPTYARFISLSFTP